MTLPGLRAMLARNKGNERADKEAKEVAAGRTSRRHALPAFLTEVALPLSIAARRQAFNRELGARWCHGLSPDPPYPSEASLPPPMVRPISDAFRSTSDPTGLSAYFSLSLTDSRMFLLAFFT